MKFLPLTILAGLVAVALALAWSRRDAASATSDGHLATAFAARPVITSPPGFPMTVDLPDGTRLELPSPARRILPVNAGVVDFLTVLVEPRRVVSIPAASDVYSRLASESTGGSTGRSERGSVREQAAPLDWGDVPRFESYSAELVLALDPDLVLTHSWQSPETTAILRDLGVPVLVSSLPASWDDVVETLRFLGRLLDAEERAAAVERELERRIAALRATPQDGTGVRALSYSNFGSGGSTSGEGTTLDVILELAGVENAAAADGIHGLGSLDHERLLSIDPDVILVGAGDDPGGYPPTAAYLFSTPSLAGLVAVREKRIVSLPTKLFSTTSLELLTAAEELQRELDRLLEHEDE